MRIGWIFFRVFYPEELLFDHIDGHFIVHFATRFAHLTNHLLTFLCNKF